MSYKTHFVDVRQSRDLQRRLSGRSSVTCGLLSAGYWSDGVLSSVSDKRVPARLRLAWVACTAGDWWTREGRTPSAVARIYRSLCGQRRPHTFPAINQSIKWKPGDVCHMRLCRHLFYLTCLPLVAMWYSRIRPSIRKTGELFEAARLRIHRVRKKEATVFFMYDFDKFRHSFVIFGTNHPKDSFH